MSAAKGKIAYQGEPGANSHIACKDAWPDLEPLACRTFQDAFAAVANGTAELAMIPIDNTVAGRVADIHHLLPGSSLHMVGEYFLRVRHQLLANRGADLSSIKAVHSHVHALGQCRKMIDSLGLKAVVAVDTAGAARELAQSGDTNHAVVATALAGEIYNLKTLRADIEDEDHNTTRFVVFSASPVVPQATGKPLITSFIFQVRNVPAALYKALGGFATNGVNMTKLESYQIDGQFFATQFYADVDGHPDDRGLALALEELSFFTSSIRILGTYEAAPERAELARKAAERQSKANACTGT